MKVSREGIVLIKSFEGFRPRAIRREAGGWVIGYGHTLSAREGASVSEADAELLLRYDLLPVEKTVNQAGSAVLNQHQFDAMVSFAFSVGIDRFQNSDVLGHLSDGSTQRAADALMGWPEPDLPHVALRRRAAERALFVADPDGPVAVSDLLVAPVEHLEDVLRPPTDAPSIEPDTLIEEVTEASAENLAEQEHEPEPPADARVAAVSALLGEVNESGSAAPEPAQSVFITAAATPHPAIPDAPPANDAVPEEEAPTAQVASEEVDAEPGPDPVEAFDQIETPEPAQPDETAEPIGMIERTDTVETIEPVETAAPQFDAPDETKASPGPDDEADAEAAASEVAPEVPEEPTDASRPVTPVPFALTLQRYSPYSAAMVGPLPTRRLSPAPVAQPLPLAVTEAVAEVPESLTVEAQPEALESDVAPLTSFPTGSEAAGSEMLETALETSAIVIDALHSVETTPEAPEGAGLETVLETPAAWPQPWSGHSVPAAIPTPAAVEPLVLIAQEDAPAPAFTRVAWTPEQRGGPFEAADDGLFGEDLSLTQGGAPILRHGETELEAPASFDWSGTGTFVIMGGVGLAGFGAAMAAFRLAAEQSGGQEMTIVGWVLAVIGSTCVGLSSFNLYRRWGLPGGDN